MYASPSTRTSSASMSSKSHRLISRPGVSHRSQRVVDWNLVAIYPTCGNGFKTSKVIVGILFNSKYAYFTWAAPSDPGCGRRTGRGCSRDRAVQTRRGTDLARSGWRRGSVLLSATNVGTHTRGLLEPGVGRIVQ